MNLADEINGLTPQRRPNECKTCWTLADADAELKVAVDDALANGASMSALAGVLARNGYDVTSDNLQRHNKKGHRLS